MNDDKPQQIQPSEPPENDAASPVPPPSGQGQWQMPKPVFKKTSGYLPQGFEKLAAFDPPPNQSAASEAAAAQIAESVSEPIEQTAPVGEQPDILEDFGEEIAETAPVPAKRSSSALRVIVGVVVFFLVLAFISGFLYLIYVLFLSGETPAGV